MPESGRYFHYTKESFYLSSPFWQGFAQWRALPCFCITRISPSAPLLWSVFEQNCRGAGDFPTEPGPCPKARTLQCRLFHSPKSGRDHWLFSWRCPGYASTGEGCCPKHDVSSWACTNSPSTALKFPKMAYSLSFFFSPCTYGFQKCHKICKYLID